MLTAVKNQIKVSLLSIKYGLQREMLNKVTFFSNIIFMILNNAAFLVQWIILFSLKDNIGGYSIKQVVLLWGLASGTFGFAHFFFKRAFSLSETITNGKLDSYLVQPKNVLLSAITSDVETSALGDMIYGYIMLIASGFTILKLILFTIFIICGGILITSFAIILASASFWFTKADALADSGNSIMTNFATYPDGIFKGMARIFLFSLFPVGIVNYIPIWVMTEFHWNLLLIVLGFTICEVLLAFGIFYRGLRRYSSTNLMISRI